MSKSTKSKSTKSTKNNGRPKLVRSIGGRECLAQVPQQKAGPDTPVPVPLGTIQAMSEFINQATGPCQLAMQIIQSLQLSVDRAGLGRQEMQHPAEAREK